MEKELKAYLEVIGFNKVSISDFYNGFIRKPKTSTKQQVTAALKEVCLKMGYDLIKSASMNKRFYSFEKRTTKMHQIITISNLKELQETDYLTLSPDIDLKEVADLIKKSKYVTNNRFKLKTGEDGISRVFRTS